MHRKAPVPESFLNKFVGLRPGTLLKQRVWHRCFPVNFANFFRTSILYQKHTKTCKIQKTNPREFIILQTNHRYTDLDPAF